MVDRRFCVAPMMDYTDRHDRYFLRLITRHAVMYSEMVTASAIIRGERHRLLDFDIAEHPIALQLGGSDPVDLAEASKIGQDWGYDEVNLNVGCPSDRVKSGCFGASLMAQPDLVARCFETMQRAVDIPVTIKCRIGIDEMDSYDDLLKFVDAVAQAGCRVFVIHARKAWLKGLSPKENREIPPLRYDDVYQLKRQRPQLEIIINGGINSLDQCKAHLEHLDGVMMGREAYHNPYILAGVDQFLYGDDHPIPNRFEVFENLIPYIESQLAKGVRLHAISRHILGLFNGLPGARAWRRHISENAPKKDSDIKVLFDAVSLVDGADVRRQAS